MSNEEAKLEAETKLEAHVKLETQAKILDDERTEFFNGLNNIIIFKKCISLNNYEHFIADKVNSFLKDYSKEQVNKNNPEAEKKEKYYLKQNVIAETENFRTLKIRDQYPNTVQELVQFINSNNNKEASKNSCLLLGAVVEFWHNHQMA